MKYKEVGLKAGRMLCMLPLVFLTGCAGTKGTESEEELPVVTIGSDSYPPYNYLNEDGIRPGFEKDKQIEALEKALREEEQEHKIIQDRLQQALDEANLKNEVISAISKSYRSIYRIDLRKDFFEEISNDHETHKLTGYKGCASEKLYQICDNMIVPEYRDLVRPFLNLATLPERLKNDEYVTTEYPMCDGSWQSPPNGKQR